jgi:UDP-glucuronate decarboxylase
MARVTITGAAGFLGSHLVDAVLASGAEVTGVDNLSTGRARNLAPARGSRRFAFRRLDLCRAKQLPAAGLYYHLASPASPPAYQRDPVATLRVNGVGTLLVLEAARRNDARVVMSSTSEVYGDPLVHPQREEYWGNVNPIGIRSCYDEGKRFAEALAVAYRRHYGLDVRIARIFNTYGPRMDPEDGRVISNFIVQGLRGQSLTVYGTGRQTRSFCYVADLIRGLVALGGAKPGITTPMNLGNPKEFTVSHLAQRIAHSLGVPLRERHMPLPADDPRQRCPDIRLARRELGWSPEIPLDEGLDRTIAYFRERLAHGGLRVG